MSRTLITLDSVSASSVFIILLLVTATANQGCRLNINYRSFLENVRNNFIFKGQSNMVQNILQVTNGLPGENLSANLTGRILYENRLKLWRKSHRVSSFNTRFVLAIAPQSNPPGEGLAIILTRDPQVPENSYGQWLGITNAGKDGTPGNKIIAFEFDTRKSFREDVDNNHFGVNINSIKSNRTTSLTQFGVNLSSLTPITATIDYDGTKKMVNVSVSMNKRGANSEFPILSMPLDLSRHLPEDVYVGFSASTSSDIQLNCITEWYFSSSDIEKYNATHFYVAILIPLTSVICMGSLACCIYQKMKWKRKCTKDEDGTLDVETQCLMLGPKKNRFKELKVATRNFNSRNELGRGGFGIVYKGVLNEIIRNDPKKLDLSGSSGCRRRKSIRLEKFDGADFGFWKMQIKDYLYQKKLYEPLLEKKPEGMKDEDWNLLDRQALGVIRLTFSRNIAFNIAKEKTTTGLMKALSSMYEKPSASIKVHLMRRLFNLRMTDGGLVAQHFNELNSITTQLSSIKIDFEDEVQALILLSSLPDSWNATVTTVSSSSGSNKLKFNDVRDLVLSEEIRRRESGELSTS
ncbi:probable L-type lectin-domain containing receptor kinase S.5 [Chenopodium quinoa]|uniref:probable L-type lectin-domain containing receptor kinase S.5 n=1 Tax=Chenopodium quinoa TaxID=63459 RepID=UPI000B785F69|nr:probable L-type lectin-domain containing receptor kinase S.5 [Chenopodium quinoa]